MCTYSEKAKKPEQNDGQLSHESTAIPFRGGFCMCKLSMTVFIISAFYLYFIAIPCPLEKTTTIVLYKSTLIRAASYSALSYSN